MLFSNLGGRGAKNSRQFPTGQSDRFAFRSPVDPLADDSSFHPSSHLGKLFSWPLESNSEEFYSFDKFDKFDQLIAINVQLKCDDLSAVRNHLAAEISTKFLVTCVHSELDEEKKADDVKDGVFPDGKRRSYFRLPSPSSVIQC